jgi:excisionase family DNA binding protein
MPKRMPSQHMQTSPDALPLRPEECRRIRFFLRRIEKGEVLETQLDSDEVAKRLGYTNRRVLNLVRDGAFPNAWKPAHNQVRIPVSDVLAFMEARQVQTTAPGEPSNE